MNKLIKTTAYELLNIIVVIVTLFAVATQAHATATQVALTIIPRTSTNEVRETW